MRAAPRSRTFASPLRYVAAAGLFVSTAVLAACSASGGDDGAFEAKNPDQGGAPPATTGPGTLGGGGSAGSGGLTEEDACAADAYSGKSVPLDMQIMLDKSASMQLDGKWDAVVAALQQFVQSPSADGIGVGLQFFPVPPSQPIPQSCNTDADCGFYGPCTTIPIFGNSCDGGADNVSCDPLDYHFAAVEIQTLPGVAPAILSSLDTADPDGNATPTRPALEGALWYATDRAVANPTHLVVTVLATDGEPVSCQGNDIDGITDLAAAAAAGNPSIKTFVIGVGAELTNLNQIAEAGGTEKAYLVDTSQDVADQFLEALNVIRSAARCEFQIPTPTSGTPNYGMINVAIGPEGQEPETVSGVGNPAACDPVEGGWYYDNPDDPNRIILCDATCQRVKDGELGVTILLGCQTQVN